MKRGVELIDSGNSTDAYKVNLKLALEWMTETWSTFESSIITEIVGRKLS